MERLAFGELLRLNERAPGEEARDDAVSVEREHYCRLLEGTGAAGGSGPQDGGTAGSGGGSSGTPGPNKRAVAGVFGRPSARRDAVAGGQELLRPGRRQRRASRRVEGARGGKEVPAGVRCAFPGGVLSEPVWGRGEANLYQPLRYPGCFSIVGGDYWENEKSYTRVERPPVLYTDC